MAIIETFSLKDHELKAIKEGAEAGNQFYGNLLAGYEQHGSLTKKQYDAYKSAVKLTSAEVAFLKRRADAEVDDDAEPERVRPRDQGVERGEVAEERVDTAMVGDVVAVVGLGRRVERGEPDGVGPEAGDGVEVRCEAREVADPVAVRVRERADVDLVDDGAAPPAGGARGPGSGVERRQARGVIAIDQPAGPPAGDGLGQGFTGRPST